MEGFRHEWVRPAPMGDPRGKRAEHGSETTFDQTEPHLKMQKAAPLERPLKFGIETSLVLRVVLHNQIWLHHHRVRHVAQGRGADEFAGHFGMVGVDIIRHIPLGKGDSL